MLRKARSVCAVVAADRRRRGTVGRLALLLLALAALAALATAGGLGAALQPAAPGPRAGGGGPGPAGSPTAGPQPDICAQLAAAGPAAASTSPVVVSRAERIRVVAFGDFGTGSPAQRAVAAAIAAYAAREPLDLGLTLGDNFYDEGLASTGDPRWKSEWEDLYGRLGVRFFASLGNHDLHNAASRDAEVGYSSLSRSWCLPRNYYTFVAGPVQFFALDTNPLAAGEPAPAQLAWLDHALAASRAPWTVVYGHHPIYSNGHHGDSAAMKSALLDLLVRRHVDVYLTGHDHDLQELVPEGGVRFLIAGGGGKPPRPLASRRCRAWARAANGFLVLTADAEALDARFIGAGGERLHHDRWLRHQPIAECRR